MICQCTYRKAPDDRCGHEMTQEDGLCDGCRHLHPQTGWTMESVTSNSASA